MDSVGRALVTGASGFVGRALCPALARAGWHVRAHVRRAASGAVGDAEVVSTGEIDERTDWAPHLRDVDVVVHLANLAHVLGGLPREAYQATNVRATQRLLDQCRAAGVRRFVYLSSLRAIGERSSNGPVDEETPCAPTDDYGASKLAAERLVRAESSVGGVIIRPPLVYGPEVRANFLRLLRGVDRRMPFPLGLVDNRRAMIYLDNLVHAVELCMRHPAAVGQTFLVRDAEELATRELVRRLARLLGRPALLVPVPVGMMRLAGKALGRGADVERLTASFSVSTSKIQSRLGWAPPFTVDQGLAATVDWYRRAAR